jgi:hypothetical protein
MEMFFFNKKRWFCSANAISKTIFFLKKLPKYFFLKSLCCHAVSLLVLRNTFSLSLKI